MESFSDKDDEINAFMDEEQKATQRVHDSISPAEILARKLFKENKGHLPSKGLWFQECANCKCCVGFKYDCVCSNHIKNGNEHPTQCTEKDCFDEECFASIKKMVIMARSEKGLGKTKATSGWFDMVREKIQEGLREAYKESHCAIDIISANEMSEFKERLSIDFKRNEIDAICSFTDSGFIKLTAIGNEAVNKAKFYVENIVKDFMINQMNRNQMINSDLKTQFPKSWGPGPFHQTDKNNTLEDVPKDSPEWRDVENEWRERAVGPRTRERRERDVGEGNSNYRLITAELKKVQRVQNPAAWAAYYSRRANLAGFHSEDSTIDISIRANEWILKHGHGNTESEIVAFCTTGLNPHFCKQGMYGLVSVYINVKSISMNIKKIFSLFIVGLIAFNYLGGLLHTS